MKRRINLIGIGTGAEALLTGEAKEKIQKSGLLIGAKRMLESMKPLFGADARCFASYKEEEILEKIRETDAKTEAGTDMEISVLYSGDTGFYSGAKKLARTLAEAGMEPVFYPGISSIVCFAAKCRVPWQDAALVSLHGTRQNAVYAVCRHEHTFLLLGGKEGAGQLLEKLVYYGLGELEAVSGTDLSYPDERIRKGRVRDFTADMLDGLTVFYIHNPEYDRRVGCHLTDDMFIRGNVPMTKSQVRASAVAALALTKDAVLYDIGAGTGSVALEAALGDGSIQVCAIERNPEAVSLIRQNRRKLCADNVEIVEGTAPDALRPLPAPTHIFIGGSGGNLREILRVCMEKNPDVRIVMTAVSLETIQEMTEILQNGCWKTAEVVQIAVSEGRRLGRYHLMNAQNPVFLAVFEQEKKGDQER